MEARLVGLVAARCGAGFGGFWLLHHGEISLQIGANYFEDERRNRPTSAALRCEGAAPRRAVT